MLGRIQQFFRTFLLVELVNNLHCTFAFIDGPPSPAESGHRVCHGLGTRNVALIIALPLAT